MVVTIKKIAEMCGVSRGTVDRVLNNRGNVKMETEQLVRQMAKQLGYKPNFAGKALAARKKFYTIGVVLASIDNAFFDDVIEGIDAAAEELSTYGVTVTKKLMKGYSDKRQIELIEELESSIHILLLNPVNSPLVVEKINQLTNKGIPVLTINTDIENSSRLCYVGSNYIAGGETASGMMNLLTGGVGHIGVVQGSAHVLGHMQRVEGFQQQVEKRFSNLKVVSVIRTEDDDIIAFNETKTMLEDNPDIDGVFISAGGSYGVCRAIELIKNGRDIRVVSFDSTPNNCDMMRRDIIQVIIDQEPFQQGFRGVHTAFSHLVSPQEPVAPLDILNNEIKILENL